MKSVIILSGPIGAGKTTVAKALVASSPDEAAYIEGDMFWSYIAKTGPNPVRFSNFKMIMRAMTAAALPFAMGGFETIVDFSIPLWYVPTACKMANFKDLTLEYVVLRPSEAVCAERAASRAEGKITNYNQYHDLYTSFDEAEQYIIENDDMDPVEAAARIREGLAAGRFRVAGQGSQYVGAV
jgi:hypothetical protein